MVAITVRARIALFVTSPKSCLILPVASDNSSAAAPKHASWNAGGCNEPVEVPTGHWRGVRPQPACPKKAAEKGAAAERGFGLNSRGWT